MSKSVLVVNTPKCCFDCDFWTDGKHCFRCIVANKKYEDNSIVQEWCPLKPLPSEKIEGLTFDSAGMAFTKEMAIGWNSFRDVILGEEMHRNRKPRWDIESSISDGDA